MNGKCEALRSPVEAFANVSFQLHLVAPEKEGRYISFWKLFTPDGVSFGQTVFVDILVTTSPNQNHFSDTNTSPSSPIQSHEDNDFTNKKLEQLMLIKEHIAKKYKVYKVVKKTSKKTKISDEKLEEILQLDQQKEALKKKGEELNIKEEELLSIQTNRLSLDPFLVINSKEITLGRKIGEGTFGTILEANWNGSVVAIKKLNPSLLNNEEEFTRFKNEIQLLSKIRHPNILNFWGTVTLSSEVYAVIEYCPNGNLRIYILTHKISYSQCLHFAFQTCKGMNYLHDRNVLHRDLKTTNLLLTETLIVKIAGKIVFQKKKTFFLFL